MRTVATYNIKTNLEEVLFGKLGVLQEINSAMEDLDDFLYGNNYLTSEELSYEGSKFQLTFDGIYGPFRDSPDEYIRLYVLLINEDEEKDVIVIEIKEKIK